MKVSIITPSYNSESWLKSTYRAIKNQTHTNWEWLVTDDCSFDGTLEVLKELSIKDSRVKYFKNSVNSGAAVSRNNSIKNATGDFLAFIDSDDLWLPKKLEEQIAFMENKINFSFTAYELIDKTESKLKITVDSTQQGFFTYQDMLRKKATLGCSTVMLRRASFDDIQMPLIRTGQDYALWLKLLKTGENAYILPEILTLYRVLPDSISRNKIKKARRQWQIYRDIEKLSVIDASINFCFYAFRAVFRKS